jgi:hypothetical protein
MRLVLALVVAMVAGMLGVPVAWAQAKAAPTWNTGRLDWQFQWAASATASSEYGPAAWSAKQLTGPPNTPGYGDYQTAWAPSLREGGVEWLELAYRYPVIPSNVQIHENLNEGSVVRVQLQPEGGGDWVTVLDRPLDLARELRTEGVVINVVGVHDYVGATRRVRIEVDTARPGWEEIDAVALIGKYVVGAVEDGQSTGAYRWWAGNATASSQYGEEGYAAGQVTGIPNAPLGSDSGAAWAPRTQDGDAETLEVQYPQPLIATELNIVESCSPGFVRKLEAQTQEGDWVTLWEGEDPTTEAGTFRIDLRGNTVPAHWYRITTDNNVPGWNEVDAVELVGNPHPDHPVRDETQDAPAEKGAVG